MSKDYYQTLGIQKGANEEEIKKAYRTQAMKYHPDKNKGKKDAEAKFKEISEAYEVLKDPQKKAAYDRYGDAAFSQGGGGGFGGFSQQQGGDSFSSFSDMFEAVFRSAQGGGFGGQAQASNFQSQGNDIRYNLDMSLEEAFSGKSVPIRFSTYVACDPCSGSGGEKGSKPSTCTTCGGRGQVRFQQSIFVVDRTCSACGGVGQTIASPCRSCTGQGRVRREKNLEVTIPAGVDNGTRIRVNKEGEAGLRGGPAGDLYVFINIKPHRVFKREGNNIYCRVPIPMVQAALGGEIDVPAIDGDHVSVKIPQGTQHGQQFKIKHKGMPPIRGNSRGDMIVETVIEVPINLSKKQKQLLEDFNEGFTKENNSPQSHGFFSKVKDFWDEISRNGGKSE